MIFTFGNYKLNIDVARTCEFYKTERHLTEGCSCGGCTNFEKAAETFPKEVKDFFAKIGVDPQKVNPDFIFIIEPNENETKICYSCTYFIYGTVLSGEKRFYDDDGSFTVEGYRVTFLTALENETIMMDCEFGVPWVLDRPFK